jgi:hypothetical protein
MQFINDTFHWWYIAETILKECPNGLAISMYLMGPLGIILWSIGCIMGEWKNDSGVIGGFFIIAIIAASLCLGLSLGGPIIVVLSVVFGFGYGLQAIGDFFRKSIKDKETKRTKALADLISSDPVFKAQYEALMKNTPEI